MFLAQLIPDITSFIAGIVNSMISALSRYFDELMKTIIDGVSSILPSTPDGFTLSALLNSFVSVSDIPYGTYYLYQTALGISLIMFAVLIYKVIKILPFT